MGRRVSSPERRISARPKKLGLSFAEMRRRIDLAKGSLKYDIPAVRGAGALRLVVRCIHPHLPECWAMSLLWNGICIDCIDYHGSDYHDSDGFRRVGWHRDEKENGATKTKTALPDFNPLTLDDFLQSALALFNIVLDGEAPDASDELFIA